ncbi:hypothetical protein UA08_05014 [Talaromyces atroroseus]|uniref:Xylanolytic transcriptional activator regulatory domain-containing protein n=1 Tax=Talaromyces atroroseus TaxID=1441469 RepID=A0A225B175_TALAT|nr:hypothetical protein UA08_05014 [Talaromyces atroroseus]OKL59557.1 hypothetical protein UA08_05014 [Talaromyces atroroseus]
MTAPHVSDSSLTSPAAVFSQQDWNNVFAAWSDSLSQDILAGQAGTARKHALPGKSPPERQQQQQHHHHHHHRHHYYGSLNSVAPAHLEPTNTDVSQSASSHRLDSVGNDNSPIQTGYMASQSASTPHYVERSFWALVHGQELICENFLDATDHDANITKPRWHGDLTGLDKLLTQIPTKSVCDLFLQSFLAGIHPIHPFIHIPKFHSDYLDFWSWHTRKQKTSLKPSDRFWRDPTFIPLLFSTLFCGAAAAPESFWSTAPPLVDLDIGSTVDQLRNCYLQGLELCKHTQYPTLNTLVAALLGHALSNRGKDILADISFFDTIVRISQSMGLHMEHSSTTERRLDPVTLETYRRVWWHVLWLDMQYSLRYGSQTRCGSEGNHWNVRMVSEASDETMVVEGSQPDLFASSIRSPNSNRTSVIVLFATGRYETVRFMHAFLNRLNSCHPLTQDDLNTQLDAFKKLHMKMNQLIGRMPVRGAPERGFVPFRMSNASMLTDESLYSDQSENPSVFISWARVTLTMLMTSALLTLQKAFLGHPSLNSENSLWVNSFRLSINYIRYLLQIVRVPAFAPYFWFLTKNVSIAQAVLLILIYLRLNPSSPDAYMALYFVDETFEILETMNPKLKGLGVSDAGNCSSAAASGERSLTVWGFLKAMRTILSPAHVENKAPTPDYFQCLFNNDCVASMHSSLSSTTSLPLSSNINSSCLQTPEITLGRCTAKEDLAHEGGYVPYLGNIQIPSGSIAGATHPSCEPMPGLEFADLESWSSIVLRNLEAFD